MKRGFPLTTALQEIVLDPSLPAITRAKAADLLNDVDHRLPLTILTQRFWEDVDGSELMEIAKIFRFSKDPNAIPVCIQALANPKSERRFATAYALGMPQHDKRSLQALIRVLTNSAETPEVRGCAAESLGGRPEAVTALVSVLSDEAVAVRFWAVWSLGGQRISGIRHRLEPLLAAKLSDPAVYLGWWSIRCEALALLGHWDLPGTEHRMQLERELESVLQDPDASAEDRHWAGFWR